MDIERLKSYTATKKPADKLTKEERDDIIVILKDVNETSAAEWQSAEECLLKLPDVMYDFICGTYSDLKDERKKELYSLLMEKVNQGSPRTVIYATVALNKCGETQKAEELLRRFVYNRWNKTKPDANKSIVNAFCNAASIAGGDFLFTKREDWKLSPLRIYAELLNAFIERDYSDANVDLIKGWYECNESAKGEIEEKKFLEILDEKKNAVSKIDNEPVKDNKKPMTASKKSSTSDKPKTRDISKCSLEEIFSEIKNRVNSLESEKQTLESDKQVLESEKQELENRLNDAEVRNDWLTKAKSEVEANLNSVSARLHDLQDSLNMSQKELAETRVELESVISEKAKVTSENDLLSSSYNQAAETSRQMMVAAIKDSLSDDHEKFIQIKSKEQNSVYYDFLIDILEKVYNALEDNGIRFDK